MLEIEKKKHFDAQKSTEERLEDWVRREYEVSDQKGRSERKLKVM